MVDELLTEQTELAEQPDDNDILYIVDAPDGTPLDKKIKVSNLLLGPTTDIATNVTAIALNTTHRGSDGSDHSKVTVNETAIALNTTHRSSVGTDHGYIDQDLQTTASPTFAGLDLTEGNITNVGEIDLDLIRADATDGSITIELDDAAGADFIVGNNNALVVEGDNDRVGIGTATPDGELHIHRATAGTVDASANANSLVIENNDNAGISILTPSTTVGWLLFGDPDNNAAGYLQYDHANTQYAIGVEGVARFILSAFELSHSGQFTISSTAGDIIINAAGITRTPDKMAIGATSASAQLHVDQASTTAAQPVLLLDQADISEGFVNHVGTSAASAAGPISTWTSGNSIQGFVRTEINGAQYWMPYYDAPSA